jgi:ribonuclease HI
MKPEFLLFSYAKVFFDDYGFHNGIWRFVLKGKEGGVPLEAFDHEDGWHVDRLSLLSVVRGLESLEQPSKVALYSPSRYVTRGFDSAMSIWKKKDWTWERFGEEVAIKNRDLWIRVDRALEFHDVDCRYYRVDAPQRMGAPVFAGAASGHKRRRTIRPADDACRQIEAVG